MVPVAARQHKAMAHIGTLCVGMMARSDVAAVWHGAVQACRHAFPSWIIGLVLDTMWVVVVVNTLGRATVLSIPAAALCFVVVAVFCFGEYLYAAVY